jgi:molecular chaperone DnaK (HSP70)
MMLCMHGVQQEDHHKCPRCRKNCEEAKHDLSDSEHQDGDACFWEYLRDVETHKLTSEELERMFIGKKEQESHHLKLVA